MLDGSLLVRLICSDGTEAVCECLLVSDCFVDRNRFSCSCMMVILFAEGGMDVVVVVVVVLVDVVIT